MSAGVGDTVDLANPGGKRAGIPITSAAVGDTVLVKKSRYGYPISSAAVGDTVLVKRVNGKLVGVAGGGESDILTDIDIRTDMYAEGIVATPSGDIIQVWAGQIVTPPTAYVKIYSSSGRFKRKFGSYGTGNGQFNVPQCVAVDLSGNIYVSDLYNYRIQKFTSAGQYLLQWGSNGTGDGQFSLDVAGIAVDSDGYVYVVDRDSQRLQKFDSTGHFITKWSLDPSSFGCTVSPTTGNIWVVVIGHSRMDEFTPTGTLVSSWSSGLLYYPYTIAFDSENNIYVADKLNYRIQKFTEHGTYLGVLWGTPGDGDGQFNMAVHVTVDKNTNNVYVGDTENFRVQQFTPTGTFIRKWYSGR
jgi:hypothetical protein